MKITKSCVVTFHYEMRDESGEHSESSREGEPVAVLYGHGGMIRGIEAALADRTSGEQFAVTVDPLDGYGPRRDELQQRVSKKHFLEPDRLRVGEQAILKTQSGGRRVTVSKVGGKMVDVDMNHPLAGLTLHFDIEVVDVREATSEEIAHGHAHGPGGHGH